MDTENGHLDSLLYSTIQETLTPANLTLELIKKRFEEIGISLTATQTDHLKNVLKNRDIGRVSVNLNEEQAKRLEATQGDDTTLRLDIPDIDKLSEQLSEAIDTTVSGVLRLISESLLEGWKSQAEEVLGEQKSKRSKVSAEIHDVWAKALDLLDMLISVCMEEGARFNDFFRGQDSENNDYVFEALTRLHARGCQVGFEIVSLLAHGFADGAHARWRTLHELTVVAIFLSERGQVVAERYLQHASIIAYAEAEQYQKHCAALGYPSISSKELDELKATHDSLLKQYGGSFAGLYGWAADAIARPTFKKIEKCVSLDHLRPFYKLANLNVHADARGAIYRIGTPPWNDSLLLAGPSVFGLADPGQNTAVSINQLTAALLLTKPNLDRLAFLLATQMLVSEVFEAFIEARGEIENEDAG
jgi:hypothetical protein